MIKFILILLIYPLVTWSFPITNREVRVQGGSIGRRKSLLIDPEVKAFNLTFVRFSEQLTQEVGLSVESSELHVAGQVWRLALYPGGATRNRSDRGRLGVFLR